MPNSNPKIPQTKKTIAERLRGLISNFLNVSPSHPTASQRTLKELEQVIASMEHDDALNMLSISYIMEENSNTKGGKVSDNIDIMSMLTHIFKMHDVKHTVKFPAFEKHVTSNKLDSDNKFNYIDWNGFWKEFYLVNHVTPPEFFSTQSDTNLRKIAEEIRTFREAAIQKLQVALNEYLNDVAQTQRPEGASRRAADLVPYEQKQSIVNFVNSSLEQLGLAIRYKGHPCYLTCLKGTSEGRFAIVPKGHNAPLLARSNLSDFLPLELIDVTRPIEVPEFAQQVLERRIPGNAERG